MAPGLQEQGENRSTTSVDRSISAAAQCGDKLRGGLSCLGGMRTRKPRRERASNNAEKPLPGQPSSVAARSTHGARSRDPEQSRSPTQGADRRSRHLPHRQMLQLGCVPDDAHKRTEHGTAEPRPCEKDSFRTQLRTTPNARTRRHGRDARHEGFHTRLFAVMQSFFCTVEECPSTHSTWRE